MTAQGGVRFLHVRAYNIMHTLTYASDFNFVTPCVIYKYRTAVSLVLLLDVLKTFLINFSDANCFYLLP